MSQPLASALSKFGAQLFEKLSEQHPATNTLVSPISIGLALALAHAGAAHATAQAIAQTLGVGDLPAQQVEKAAAALMNTLGSYDQTTQLDSNAESAMQLRIANALFVNKQVTLQHSYAQTSREQFSAEVASLDFGRPDAAPIINGWVNQQTRGRIKQIIQHIDNRTIALLLNALYFKAAWQRPFAQAATRPERFTLADQSTIEVPMMNSQERYLYQKGPGFEAIGLPFKGASDLLMIVVLPPRGASATEVTRLATDPRLLPHLKLRNQLVHVRMPRFRIEYEVQLNQALIALGMGLAFDAAKADFSPMLADHSRLAISEVLHKTYLDVNEYGAEAAAVTAIHMVRAAMIIERPIEVVVDRPFACAIYDQQAEALLFLATVFQPNLQ